jgi:hypothetical protein
LEAYSAGLIANANIGYAFARESALEGLSIAIGGGGHRIDHIVRVSPTEIKTIGNAIIGDPFVRLGYEHLGSTDWGLSAQYSNMMLLDGYFEIFSGFALQAKYALRLNHRNEPYEYDSYFVLSPRIKISI